VRKRFAVFVACFLFLGQSWAAQFFDGHWVLKNLGGSPADVAFATGYVMGIHDAVDAISLSLRLDRAVGKLPPDTEMFCFVDPPVRKGNDIALQVRTWLTRNL
jgi:hypothetical protein